MSYEFPIHFFSADSVGWAAWRGICLWRSCEPETSVVLCIIYALGCCISQGAAIGVFWRRRLDGALLGLAGFSLGFVFSLFVM